MEEDCWILISWSRRTYRTEGYPPEFKRRVVDLVEDGREVAADLGISEQSVYPWRRQARIDAGH